ncbi:MAG: ABC transporter substrate-binding protein [Betaproteobacteria bacterium]|nr:ABC transporter substrate-binding protein [Betaproteobacteria bacterium]
MNRRESLFAMLALGAAPLGADAQLRAKPARVATFQTSSPETLGYLTEAFKQAMRELGYIEGKTIVFESRWAMGRLERLPELAKEIVASKPDVILVGNINTTVAAREATAAIPIVMATSIDPVGSGLIKSLARPGGNITGLSNMAVDLGPKLLELLLTVVPKPARLAVLVNPANSGHATLLESVRAPAQKAGIKVLTANVQASQEIETAFSMMARENAGALIVALDALFNQHTRRIAELAAKHRLPSIAGWPQYAEAGGLMSYGQNLVENFRRAATYVDKILKGAKPGELPVEQPTKIELVVNLRTAKVLDLKISQSVMLRADRAIE